MPVPLSGLTPKILSTDAWDFITSVTNSDMRTSLGVGNTDNPTFNSVNTSHGTSSQWGSTYTTVKTNSASWGVGGSEGISAYSLLSANSGKWNSTYANVNANSAQWSIVSNLTELAASSAKWNSTYANVNASSGSWNSVFTNVNTNSAAWSTLGNTISSNYLSISGGIVTGSVSVVGSISTRSTVYSQELDFGSSERPSITGVKQYLNTLLYVPPAISYFRINGSLSQTLEVGQELVSPSITWTSTKVEAPAISAYQLTLPTGATTIGTGTYTFSSYSDSNTYDINTIPGTASQAQSSWSIKVTDWTGAQATNTVTASWRYRVYYGATNVSSPVDTDILTGAETSSLTTSRLGLGAKTISLSNEYLFVAYPQRFGTTSTIKVNGFNFTDITQVSIATFTNSYGGTDSYYVYRSNNLLTGTYTVEII